VLWLLAGPLLGVSRGVRHCRCWGCGGPAYSSSAVGRWIGQCPRFRWKRPEGGQTVAKLRHARRERHRKVFTGHGVGGLEEPVLRMSLEPGKATSPGESECVEVYLQLRPGVKDDGRSAVLGQIMEEKGLHKVHISYVLSATGRGAGMPPKVDSYRDVPADYVPQYVDAVREAYGDDVIISVGTPIAED
jgi:hypothetical protein